MLPGLSGIEVLEAIRSDEELKDMPVVVITAWSHAEVDAQVAGADRFVSKPFDPDELSGAVEELLAMTPRAADVAASGVARADRRRAAFAALILAVSAQREATEREARSKDVTAASLRLEKLVVDVETGFRGFTRHAGTSSTRAVHDSARRSCPAAT